MAIQKNDFVIIRTQNMGVHFGRLVERQGRGGGGGVVHGALVAQYSAHAQAVSRSNLAEL